MTATAHIRYRVLSSGVSAEEYTPWTAAVEAARAHFVQVVRSFWLIPELITPVALDDVSLLYCFCRELDDAVDEAPDLESAKAALAQWRAEVLGEAPPRPLIAAFLAGAPRSGLPLACVESLLEGMEADLGLVRLADDDALVRYSYQVSSAVGLMLAPLLGVKGEDGAHRVVDLGVGLQVSNVLLGVASDAKRGRVYLPATRLAEAGLTHDDVLANPGDPRLKPVLEGLAELGDRYYRSAQLGAVTVPFRYRHGVLLLGRVYGAMGREAAQQHGAPVTPMNLSAGQKVWHLTSLAVVGLHPRVMGWSAVPAHDPSLHLPLVGLAGAHRTQHPSNLGGCPT